MRFIYNFLGYGLMLISGIFILCLFPVSHAQPNISKPQTYFHIRLINENPPDNAPRLTSLNKNRTVVLFPEILLDLSHVASISQIPATKHNPYHTLQLHLTPQGKEKLLEITQNNLKKRVGILINNQLIDTPTIISEVRNGKFPIPILQSADQVKTTLINLQQALEQLSK